MRKLILIFSVFAGFISCNMKYHNDPAGYKTLKETKFDRIFPESDTATPGLFTSRLVNDTAHFNWLFYKQRHGGGYGIIPTVDFNTQSFYYFSFNGEGETMSLKKGKVLINEDDKKILIKCLLNWSAGGGQNSICLGCTMPKVDNSYQFEVKSWTTK